VFAAWTNNQTKQHVNRLADAPSRSWMAALRGRGVLLPRCDADTTREPAYKIRKTEQDTQLVVSAAVLLLLCPALCCSNADCCRRWAYQRSIRGCIIHRAGYCNSLNLSLRRAFQSPVLGCVLLQASGCRNLWSVLLRISRCRHCVCWRTYRCNAIGCVRWHAGRRCNFGWAFRRASRLNEVGCILR